MGRTIDIDVLACPGCGITEVIFTAAGPDIAGELAELLAAASR